MLSWIVGILLILGGLGWAILAMFGPMMASRQIDTWDEQVKPMLYGLVPIALGIAIIIWR